MSPIGPSFASYTSLYLNLSLLINHKFKAKEMFLLAFIKFSKKIIKASTDANSKKC